MYNDIYIKGIKLAQVLVQSKGLGLESCGPCVLTHAVSMYTWLSSASKI